jgi:hypothetical protein
MDALAKALIILGKIPYEGEWRGIHIFVRSRKFIFVLKSTFL